MPAFPSGSPGSRARLHGALAAAALLAAACARPMPPPGGPADTTAPMVVAVSPESLAVDVPVDAPLVVTFSEKVEQSTLERALWITPGGAVKPDISVSGPEATIRLGAPLPDSVTVGVLLTTVITDRRRGSAANPLREPYRWIFATGDSLWPGTVSGTVTQVGRTGTGGPGRGQVLVGLYPGDADTLPDPSSTTPVAVTEARSDGGYTLAGLPADGRRRWLIAMLDRNGNREISGPGEFASVQPESLVLTGAAPRDTVELRLVDPEAPGSLSGAFTRAEGDSVALWVAFFEAGTDTTGRPRTQVRAQPDGNFKAQNLPPGDYSLAAFCDLNRNGRRDPEEPWTLYTGTIEVEPGGERALEPLNAPDCRR